MKKAGVLFSLILFCLAGMPSGPFPRVAHSHGHGHEKACEACAHPSDRPDLSADCPGHDDHGDPCHDPRHHHHGHHEECRDCLLCVHALRAPAASPATGALLRPPTQDGQEPLPPERAFVPQTAVSVAFLPRGPPRVA